MLLCEGFRVALQPYQTYKDSIPRHKDEEFAILVELVRLNAILANREVCERSALLTERFLNGEGPSLRRNQKPVIHHWRYS